ncbi:MAG: hypothetical protein IBX43_05235 [Campylobacterales bacterium]|nr:hypothetical protein [Campylobacterales bacterium]
MGTSTLMYKKLLISFLLLILVVLSSMSIVDKISSNQLDRAFTRAVSVFAIARGLNGVISVVQGTEVYATPAGVGVNFAVGQIVDPMNDMVERFSWVMLMSSVSLGVQEIVLHLGQTQPVRLLFALSVLFLLLMLWVSKLWHAQSFNFIFKFLVVFLFLRFAVPMVVLANQGIYAYALEPRYLEAKAALELSSTQIEEIVSEVRSSKHSQIEVQERSFKEGFFETLEYFNIKKHYQNLSKKFQHQLQTLEEKFEHAIAYILTLITIFIVESIILPLLVLWGFLKLFRGFLHSDMAGYIEKETTKNT